MITFDDVRRADELTFTSVPCSRVEELTHFLALAGFGPNDYEVLSEDEMRESHPDVPVEPAYLFRPTGLRASKSYTCVVVSRLNADDLARKFDEIYESPEAEAWREEWAAAIEATMADELREIREEAERRERELAGRRET